MNLQPNLPVAIRTERRSSITTGVVERVEVPVEVAESQPLLPAIGNIPHVKFYNENNLPADPDDSNLSDSDEEPSPEALARYLAMRRHTVGVGDSRHEVPEDVRVKLAHHQPIIAMPQPNMFMPCVFLPDVNLPQNVLPSHGDMQPVSVEDAHLLQLPTLLGPGGIAYLNRRASDGGANVHLYQRPVCMVSSMPSSRETLSTHSQLQSPISPTGLPLPTPPLQGSVTVEEKEDGNSDQEPDAEALQRYMANRGRSKRHTLAMSSAMNEIPEELQRKLSLQQPIRSGRRASHLGERVSSRDSYKDVNSLHLPNERFSPVRRASDGLANLHKYQSHLEKLYNQTVGQQTSPRHSSQTSLKQLQHECQELQKQVVGRYSSAEVERQQQHTLHRLQNIQQPVPIQCSSVSPVPTSPVAPPGSPNFQQSAESTSLYQHLQRLHLHQHIQNGNQATFHRSSPPTMAAGISPQRTDSPPQNYTPILTNFPQPHQRSSPPPNLANFQNLQMIREDSSDLAEQLQTEEVMQVQDDPELSKQDMCLKNPQISLTDASGFVTDISDVSRSDGSAHKNEQSSGKTPTFQAHRKDGAVVPPTTIPLHINYNSLWYHNHINTDLTNIQPKICANTKTAAFTQLFSDNYKELGTLNMINPQFANFGRLQRCNPVQFHEPPGPGPGQGESFAYNYFQPPQLLQDSTVSDQLKMVLQNGTLDNSVVSNQAVRLSREDVTQVNADIASS